MSVVSCTLKTDGREHEVSADGQRTNQLVYQVRTDDPTDDGWEVYAGMQVAGPDPAPGWMAAYITSAGATDFSNFARRFVFKQPDAKSPTLWDVTVGFLPLPPGGDPTFTQSVFDGGYDPLAEPPRYWVEQRTVTRIEEHDRDGSEIKNPAGQPYDEPVEEEVELDVINVSFNVASAAAGRALARKFSRKLNATPYLGYPAEWLYCLPIKVSDSKFANNVRYYQARVQMLANDKPWRREFVARGWKHLVDDPENPGESKLVVATEPVADASGEPSETRTTVSEPVLISRGAFEATANLSADIDPTVLTVGVGSFVAAVPTGESQPAAPTLVENRRGLTLSSGTSVRLRKIADSWVIIQSPPGTLDTPAKAGYRVPEGQLGAVDGFATKQTIEFSELPFDGALPA